MTNAQTAALQVLLALRLKSFVDTEVVAAAAMMTDPLAASTLVELAAGGFVTHRTGRVDGWSLTTAGRIEGERLLAAELDAARCREVIDDAYNAFVDLNPRFLRACTSWQVRAEGDLRIVNDHDDAAYDTLVIAELNAIDDLVQPICRNLAAALPRFGYYNGRLATARFRVGIGEHDWFTAPMIDSYHSVWFELHENLLATLNRERSGEIH
jgi:hypothetical protein